MVVIHRRYLLWVEKFSIFCVKICHIELLSRSRKSVFSLTPPCRSIDLLPCRLLSWMKDSPFSTSSRIKLLLEQKWVVGRLRIQMMSLAIHLQAWKIQRLPNFKSLSVRKLNEMGIATCEKFTQLFWLLWLLWPTIGHSGHLGFTIDLQVFVVFGAYRVKIWLLFVVCLSGSSQSWLLSFQNLIGRFYF